MVKNRQSFARAGASPGQASGSWLTIAEAATTLGRNAESSGPVALPP
jgi:hypothetical protein